MRVEERRTDAPRGGRKANRRAAPEKSRRRRKKRRLSRAGRLVVLACVLVVLALGAGAAAWFLLPVKTVEAEGKTPYSEEKIIQVSGIAAGDRLFGVDKKKTARLLETNLPYIASVSVSWQLPGKLVLHLTKAVPAAAVARKSGYAILDKNGKILETPANLKAFSGLMAVTGPDTGTLSPGQTIGTAAKARLEAAVTLLASIKEAGISNVTSVNVSDLYQISFGYQNRITVMIGTTSDFDEKLHFAAYMLSKELQSTEKGTLDVSKAAQNNQAVFSPATG